MASSSLLCAARPRALPKWLGSRPKALDLLLSQTGFALVPLLGAQKTMFPFLRVSSALSADDFSVCFSSGISLTTLYSIAHIAPSQHHDH